MENAQTTSPFPAPPEFAKQYTEENIKNGAYLPPPPIPMHYTVFNEEYNLEGVSFICLNFKLYCF